MDIKTLKNKIENKQHILGTFVFKYIDNTFIINQYIKSILSYTNYNICYIDDLESLKYENQLLEENNNLYIYNTDKLDKIIETKYNLIIICKSIDKNIIDNIQNLIEFPKLENWQILDYVSIQLPKIPKETIEWLCNITHYDIYRLNNEISKLKLLNIKPYNNDVRLLYDNGNYDDLSSLNIFNLSNSIIKKDIQQLTKIFKDIQILNIDGLTLTSILEKNFINILNIQTNPRITAEDLNLNYKQFTALKYNCGIYNTEKIIEILKLLTTIDFKVKMGLIPYNNLVDYIIINILN